MIQSSNEYLSCERENIVCNIPMAMFPIYYCFVNGIAYNQKKSSVFLHCLGKNDKIPDHKTR
jgi:hypothetical protein